MEELAAETISLALREKCNIIKVEGFRCYAKYHRKWELWLLP